VIPAVLLVPILLAVRAPTRGDPPQESRFFQEKVLPILRANCYRCHSHAAGKSKGGLVLDSLGAMLKGGDRGPAIVPRRSAKSLLIQAIGHAGELRMPPTRKLSEEQIGTLTEWVRLGAPWPGPVVKAEVRPRSVITEEDRRFWSLQPVKAPPLPEVEDPAWSVNPIDRFVWHKLRSEGLTPASPASRAARLRRVTFDLIGLPPTPAEIAAFEADNSPDAYEKLIDRLLADPRYGERWARHWLDLVRYAESDGFRLDEYRPHAWRYRDYVIRSFNADKPYDRFVREQLAGDELAPDDLDALQGTSFLRLGIYEYNQRDVQTQWSDMLNEITDVVGDAFLGMGMGCARCHDHKFDPILQKDYFRLRAFFAPIQPHDEPLATRSQREEYRQRLAAWEEKTKEVRARLEAMEAPERIEADAKAVKKFPEDIQAMLYKAEADRSPLEKQLAALAYRQVQYEFDHIDRRFKDERKKQWAEIQKELSRFDGDRPAPLPVGLIVRDVGPEAPLTRLPKKAKEVIIDPGFLSVLDEKSAVIRSTLPSSTGRRAELARWLTRPDHPLTARVMVNRIWQHHFGRGLVATPSDFGRLGDRPSHPEMLDWLADRFVKDGWSVKKLHRLILTSMTYRQSGTHPSQGSAMKKDPENRWLWHAATRRLDAEQIRDAMLAVTGRLEDERGGPSVDVAKPRRTIYTKQYRNKRDPILGVFDAPDGIAPTGRRDVTTTPVQALLLMNSPFMRQQSKALAERLARDHPGGDEERVEAVIPLLYGRNVTAAERRSLAAFLRDQGRSLSRNESWADLCQVLMNANEFLYVD
jgi:hypothetical protein